jgi:hypothetical protein
MLLRSVRKVQAPVAFFSASREVRRLVGMRGDRTRLRSRQVCESDEPTLKRVVEVDREEWMEERISK